jgi:hypothetical protein
MSTMEDALGINMSEDLSNFLMKDGSLSIENL